MTRTLVRTPAADGYWMPAEWDRHASTWLLWPERTDNWRDGALPAQAAFAAVATAISAFEQVSVGASKEQYEFARARLPAAIRLLEIASNDAWMRDVGPTVLVNEAGRRRGIDWQFNAWGGLQGGLYFPWDQDDLVARKVLEIEGLDRYRASFVLEGGAIHTDGQGTLLVTEECLLNPNRNPALSKTQIEALLRKYLGVSTIIWLGDGVVNDETDGHIDNLACFARPGEVCLTWTDNRRDPQWRVSNDALERLKATRDARGRPFTVHKLPAPGPLRMTKAEASGVRNRAGTQPRHHRERLAASYANFYLCNGGLIMPLLDARTDALAATRLKRIFPTRHVVGVPSREILLGGGNIHCITQQIPAAKPRRVTASR
ncbi:MAG: agmatine deiminase [Steroidobacteraceae bacterium]